MKLANLLLLERMVKPVNIFGAALAIGAGVVTAFNPPSSLSSSSTTSRRVIPTTPLHVTATPDVVISTPLHMTVGSSSTTTLDRPTLTPSITDPYQSTDSEHAPNSDWILRIYNDNINTREYVAVCLVQVVGLCESRAYHTMQDAHDNGIAKVGEYNQEVAECYEEQLVERGIMCDVVASVE